MKAVRAKKTPVRSKCSDKLCLQFCQFRDTDMIEEQIKNYVFPMKQKLLPGLALVITYIGGFFKKPHSTFAQTYMNRWTAVTCPKMPNNTISQPSQPSPQKMRGTRISIMPKTRISTSRSALPRSPP
jgi:hypothetical protein